MSTPHTDRELLEMAARAAGVSIVPCTCNNPKWPFKHAGDWSRGHWNPLESDADALRLAVKLGMCILSDQEGASAGNPGGTIINTVEVAPGDAAGVISAVRRAIVLTAAEMGQAIP